MKKILLLPIAIAISSKVYAGKLATLGTLLLMATSAMGDPTATHNALTQNFCVATPPQQMYSLDEVKTDLHDLENVMYLSDKENFGVEELKNHLYE